MGRVVTVCANARRCRATRVWAGIGLLGLVAWLAACGRSATRGEIHFADALERLALGDSAQAMDLLEQANYELGGDARVLVHMGRLQAAQGTLDSRARARALLLEAIQRQPQVGLYHAALGELLREQRFMRASTRELHQALRLDPRQGRAWRLLGQNLLERYLAYLEEPPILDSAATCFERALGLNENDAEARYALAFLHLHHGRHEAARQLLLPKVQRDCPGRLGLLLVAVDYHAKRFEAAQELAEAALACMPDHERESWLGLQPLLHPDSVGDYRVLAAAERDSSSRRYWWNEDPTPATPTNERLVEHLCRAVEADFYFPGPWLRRDGKSTARGEVYVRYGPPTLARRIGESLFPAWEWRYRSKGPYDVTFVFVDHFLNGNYLRLRRGVFSDFIEPSALEAQPSQTSLVFIQPDGGWKHVLRQFRGEEGRTAVEIAYEFGNRRAPTGLHADVAAWRGPEQVAKREQTSVQRASLFALAKDRYLGRLRVELPPEKLLLGLELSGLERLEAPGDSSKATLRVAWHAAGRETVELTRYNADALMMSDLMLAHVLHDGAGGLFDMGGVIAVPRVDDRIEHEKLHLYFEIYPSRRLLRDRTPLAVRYAVRPLPPRQWSFWDQLHPDFRRRMDPKQQPAVQATFTFLPASDLERQQLSIDLGALHPGSYELEVELVDTATGEETSRRAEFDYAPAGGS